MCFVFSGVMRWVICAALFAACASPQDRLLDRGRANLGNPRVSTPVLAVSSRTQPCQQQEKEPR